MSFSPRHSQKIRDETHARSVESGDGPRHQPVRFSAQRSDGGNETRRRRRRTSAGSPLRRQALQTLAGSSRAPGEPVERRRRFDRAASAAALFAAAAAGVCDVVRCSSRQSDAQVEQKAGVSVGCSTHEKRGPFHYCKHWEWSPATK